MIAMHGEFVGGVMLMYLVAGAYVYAVATQDYRYRRRWLGLLVFMLLWPLFLVDVEIDKRH
jgi:hypothetical protein